MFRRWTGHVLVPEALHAVPATNAESAPPTVGAVPGRPAVPQFGTQPTLQPPIPALLQDPWFVT